MTGTSSKQKEIFELFSNLEDLPTITAWNIQGNYIWPIFRLLVGHEMIVSVDAGKKNQIVRRKSLLLRLININRLIFRFFYHIILDLKSEEFISRKADIVFLVGSSTRYFKLKQKWFNPFSDTLTYYFDQRGLKTFCYELSSNYLLKTPRFRKSKLIQLRILSIQIWVFLKSKFRKIDFSTLHGFDIFKKEILSRFPDHGFVDEAKLNLRLQLFFAYKEYFGKKLINRGFLYSFNDGYYTPEVLGFTAACKELNIFSVDIQHGVQGEFHIAYRQWKNIPKGGYPMLPDAFWIWSKIEFDSLSRWTSQNSSAPKLILGGNPGLQVVDKFGLEGDSISKAKLSKSLDRSKKQVLITTQIFDEFPTHLIQFMQRNNLVFWWIRTHPAYKEVGPSIAKQLKKAGVTNFNISLASELPLATLMKACSLHITEFSSSTIEAHLLGLPTILLNPKGREIFHDLIKLKEAHYCPDYAQLELVWNEYAKARVPIKQHRVQDGINRVIELRRSRTEVDGK